MGEPQVAYRESIAKAVGCEGKFIKQTGGRGQSGHVCLKIELIERGSGYQFVNVVGDVNKRRGIVLGGWIILQ